MQINILYLYSHAPLQTLALKGESIDHFEVDLKFVALLYTNIASFLDKIS